MPDISPAAPAPPKPAVVDDDLEEGELLEDGEVLATDPAPAPSSTSKPIRDEPRRRRSPSPIYSRTSSSRRRSRSRSRSRDRDSYRDYRSGREYARDRYRDDADDRRKRRRSRSASAERPARGATKSRRTDTPAAAPAPVEEKLEDLVDLDFPDEDEEERERRLIEERRRRRQEMVQQLAASASASRAGTPTSTAAAPDAAIPLSKPLSPVKAAIAPPPAAADSPTTSLASSLAPSKSAHGADRDVDDDDDDDDEDSLFTHTSAVAAAAAHPRHRSQAEMDLLRAKDHGDLPGFGETAPVAAAPARAAVPAPAAVVVADEDEDDDDDMFSTAPAKPVAPAAPTATATVDVVSRDTLADGWDDHEGYYRVLIGELLDGRYRVTSTLGKGVFSIVAKCVDETTGNEVAIKLIRNNETMYKAGQKELGLLRRLMDNDPDDKKHFVRLLGSFEHRNHLCMAFESLSMNLREVLKKYGNNVGLNLRAVRLYAHQLFLALSLLRKSNIIHADLKPDNILVNEAKSVIKVCDLGSASDIDENDITPYLVSRFYRAPEIILGLPYDPSIDMWSAACTLFELATGQILFPGRSNNHMLRLHMELKGTLSHRMIKRGAFGPKYFDERWQFAAVETNKLTGKDVVKHVQFKGGAAGASREIRARLGKPEDAAEGKLQAQLADLIDRCLQLNPEKRLTPIEALKHPFITGKAA
ncbi:U4/U6 small nuclear ribonucleoprotein prp4 [Blastocladiella emersonii ATCC 22665]|nr:U4/U6 small nuclear ribonucleoprotein prp4 [Blastocladiella emersonii ATCC 22665]